MSQQIDHIIFVLNDIRQRNNGRDSLRFLRISAAERRANELGIDTRSVHDAYTKQLTPRQHVGYFDSLIRTWIMENQPLELKAMLLREAKDRSDQRAIEDFFAK